MLSAMLDPATAREFLAKSLPLFQEPEGLRLLALRVRDTRPGKGWVQYSAELLDPDTGARSSQILVAEHHPNSTSEKAARHLRHQAERHRNRALAQLVLHQPEVGLLVFPFPLDSRLPHLVEAADPAKALVMLASLVPGAKSCQVDVLRYVPGVRCQILYTLRRAGGASVQFLGKMLRGGRGERLFRDMEQVADLYAANADPCLVAPRPLTYLAGWDMVVQEKIPGTTLNELLHKETAVGGHLEAAARSIAVLHSGEMLLDREHEIADELDLIASSWNTLSASGFHEQWPLALLNRIWELGGALGPSTLVPVHRDFYDKQLLVGGPKIALIDLDTLAMGHAEIDLANFVAHLHLRALQGMGSARPAGRAHTLLSAYCLRATRPPDATLLRFYFASACFRLACKYRPGPGGARIAAALFRLAEDRLGGSR